MVTNQTSSLKQETEMQFLHVYMSNKKNLGILIETYSNIICGTFLSKFESNYIKQFSKSYQSQSHKNL